MKVAIIAISRLENDYINEWIQHHLNIGVDHIYVYDNSSMEEEKISGAVYEKFLPCVTIIPAYDKVQFQMAAYKDAYYKYGNIYDYLIYIDIDEFIMLQKDNNIKDFICKFPEDLECYRMNWELYGDNEIINRDVRRSVVADFTKPAIKQRSTTTKSIIKGGLDGIDFVSVHYAIRNLNGKRSNLKTYYGNFIDITKTLPIESKSLNINVYDYSQVKLNHYITKSICEFICQKMRRPDAAWNYERNIDKDFFSFNEKTPEKVKAYEESKNIINYYFWSPKYKFNYENAGDYYNKLIINKLYHCICNQVNNIIDPLDKPVDMAICGSVMNHKHIQNVKYILGCGILNSKPAINNNPSAYRCVRGKLTKERLLKQGINVSGDIKFVDAGLMVSYIYDLEKIQKKYKIGIIPHVLDEDVVMKKYADKYNIISMKTTDILSICRRISECDIILSSSLHGIIFSHSLRVPAYHIELNELQCGDNFKFKDYYSCYDRNINYTKFKCVDGVIPIDSIIEYDKNNRSLCNPTADEIEQKQKDFLLILPYRNLLNKKYKINGESEIHVCLTSYKGRINVVHKIISSLLNQSIKCYVHLTLSSDEFTDGVKSLPNSLLNIDNPMFSIHWVKRNIKPFKKSLYTLKYIPDDSIVVTVDDDIVMPKNIIEDAVRDFDGTHPLGISNNITSVGYYGKMYTPTGRLTVYNKKMVSHWDEIISDDIISTNDDDRFMLSLFWLNGYYNKPIGSISMSKILIGKIDTTESLTDNLSRSQCMKMATNSDSIISESVKKITGKELYESFGYYNNETSHNLYSNDTYQPPHSNPKLEKLIRLRRDINEGRIIRIKNPNGAGFIWKRIK